MYYAVLKKAKLSIAGSCISAALSSFSLSLIPLTAGNDVTAYVIAAVFWAGLLVTLVAVFMTRKILSKPQKEMMTQGLIPKRQPIGLVSFSKDWRMWIVYGVTALGLVLVVTDIIIGYVPEKIMFPIISVTILSFVVHCVVDGKNYRVYKRIKERIEE